jgi:hypothetical protein
MSVRYRGSHDVLSIVPGVVARAKQEKLYRKPVTLQGRMITTHGNGVFRRFRARWEGNVEEAVDERLVLKHPEPPTTRKIALLTKNITDA